MLTKLFMKSFMNSLLPGGSSGGQPTQSPRRGGAFLGIGENAGWSFGPKSVQPTQSPGKSEAWLPMGGLFQDLMHAGYLEAEKRREEKEKARQIAFAAPGAKQAHLDSQWRKQTQGVGGYGRSEVTSLRRRRRRGGRGETLFGSQSGVTTRRLGGG